MTALLEVDGLSVRLPVNGGVRTVLHDVSFSLRAGQALGLVGESGSGKSMTARTIARLLPAGAVATGRVDFDGESVLDLRGEALRAHRASAMSMIFQDPRAHTNPVRRIGDFLTEALRTNDGMKPAAANRRAVELLAEVGIDDGARRLRQYPHELSGGLLQRVMIAAALTVRPRLILADEPTTALDVTTQAEVMAVLDRLHREHGMAMLLITHDLDLAGAVCDRTVVMYAGSIVEDRPSSRLHTDPLHPYTAALVQARPDISRTARLTAIPGQPLSAFEAPIGCAFAARCTHVEDRCRAGHLELQQVEGGRTRCRRSEELSGRLLGQVREVMPVGPAPSRQNMLSVEGLRKVYPARGSGRRRDFVAVDDVSLSVARGGSLAIVGESGSGKSTIAHMLVGLERPTAGRILINGADRTTPRRRAKARRERGRDIQIVPQDPYTTLDPRQTVADCLAEVVSLHLRQSKARTEQRVRDLVALVGLDDRQLRARPRVLSGGQRQRVAIARALAAEPKILILDESLASLDVSIQAQILNLLADIRARTGVTYLLISHDLAVVRQITDYAIVMRQGVIVERGATPDILDHPTASYTRSLLDSVPRPGWTPSGRRTARTVEPVSATGLRSAPSLDLPRPPSTPAAAFSATQFKE